MWEVKEQLEVRNLHINHITIQSELKYLIGAKVVRLKFRVFGGKTSPNCNSPGFRVVKPVAMVRFRSQP